MRDEGPRKAEYARIALEWSARELRQLPIVTMRQIVTDNADLFLDRMKVIDEPVRSGSDRPFIADC